MSQTQTKSATATYTDLDVENVVRRVKADLVMMADSTGGWTPDQARNYAHDVEVLAKGGYLRYVDVTLFSAGVEQIATRFDVSVDASQLTASRPGGLLWPRLPDPRLRIILVYTDAYSDTVRASLQSKLKINWTPTNEDTSHSRLNDAGGRNYTSNSFGMIRKEWAA
jgi:hypothetical protein